MTDSRDKIAAKIRALLSKTVENGCTEDEAIAAAQMAAKLLQKHNMTVDETELRSNPFRKEKHQQADEIGERLWKVADAIAKLTGSRYWRSAHGIVPVEITFFGFTHEVEISKYLLAICVRAMSDGKKACLRENALLVPARRRSRLLAFLDGMADRLAQRILDLREPDTTGTGLVPLRNALIDAALAAQKIKLTAGSGRKSRDLEDSYRDGLTAAEGVSLSRGVGQGYQKDNLKIERKK